MGTIPKYKKDGGTDAQVERSRLREQCGYRGRGQRSQSRSRGPKPRGGHHQFHHSSAGERNHHGDRVSHPAQDRGRRRAGAGRGGPESQAAGLPQPGGQPWKVLPGGLHAGLDC